VTDDKQSVKVMKDLKKGKYVSSQQIDEDDDTIEDELVE